jgi:hypothetical protein
VPSSAPSGLLTRRFTHCTVNANFTAGTLSGIPAYSATIQ